ncbi:interleukin-1 receptor-like 1 [Centropristis striata]|uniref:interleukin-1 receptor-like 1 n=1 Tax=Centropristis striata TaxID=184440 RepID=UPI0027DF8972|nr:interleukin-1 receptor-like 1 [Centropristis striata]
MDTFRLLFVIYMVITASECSAEPVCEDFDEDEYNVLEGEAFYFVPYVVDIPDIPDDNITWYKKNIQTENITTDENKNVHYHGGALFFLNLHTEDSGFYTARHTLPSGECYNYYLKLEVFKASPTTIEKLLYGEIEDSNESKKVPCPSPVKDTCKMLGGNLSWNKDNKPLEGRNEADLRIYNATKDVEGIYTCICTWTHNNTQYKSSGSRRVKHQESYAHEVLTIISPTNKEQFGDEGVGIKLNCSVVCGINVKDHCDAHWMINGNTFHQIEGYNQTTETVNESPSMKTISTAILTIEKVSAKDFKSEFECVGVGFFEVKSTTSTLKQRSQGWIIPLVVGAACLLLFCVFAALLVKCFVTDLTLCFRRCFPQSSCKKDARVYDAYVIYQMQSENKFTEDTLCQFVTNILPSVLEEKCGYRLFIQGRDDVPREDRVELVEDRIKQSKRLMVILAPGSGSENESTDQLLVSPKTPVIGGFDWQVGLHNSLFKKKTNVILIQLGNPGPQGYTDLPADMQHLILKSSPIRWPLGLQSSADWNSRFWKRIRYLMPARPAKKCPQPAFV